jgi:hypothetical protein
VPTRATYRRLSGQEVRRLQDNGNTCADWSVIRVRGAFDPGLVRNCRFDGPVRLGALSRGIRRHEGLSLPRGLYDSRLGHCEVGDAPCIHHVRLLSRCRLGRDVLLLDVGQLLAGGAQGPPAEIRLINEAGGRSILIFEGLLPADAWLWARHRDDPPLLNRLRRLALRQPAACVLDECRIGDGCVIAHARLLRDVTLGPACRVVGAESLQRLTVHSSPDEPTHIGAAVQLADGLVGPGCRIDSAAQATAFVLGDHCRLEQAARVSDVVIGDNSAIACCEIRNSLIFNSHQQHHNNSFLIAAQIAGQSNLAAGATIGSNHNSRANDGEIIAGRGFWPGLCTSLKHSSRFASYVLLATGDYTHELDIPLPFCLVSQDAARGRLLVMPAFWWFHNLYALARNDWKFRARDARRHPRQHIEFGALAPDTVDEIRSAMALLERWVGQAYLSRRGSGAATNDPSAGPSTLPGDPAEVGRRLLAQSPRDVDGLEILGERLENSTREVVILKPRQAWSAYRQMLHHYAVGVLLDSIKSHGRLRDQQVARPTGTPRAAASQWANLGGQVVRREDLLALLRDVRAGRLASWQAIHRRYDRLHRRYDADRSHHARAVLLELLGTTELSADLWRAAREEAQRIQQFVCDQVLASRQKDYENPFRLAIFGGLEQMEAVIGKLEDDPFIRRVRSRTKSHQRRIRRAMKA